MAKLHVVAIKDRALDAFMRPFVVPHRGLAVRGFSDEVSRIDSEMHKHPDDYDLYSLGMWDEDSGLFYQEGIELLMRGKDVLNVS